MCPLSPDELRMFLILKGRDCTTMKVGSMDQRAGMLCTLNGVLLLEWFLIAPVTPALFVAAFFLAAVTNWLFCFLFLKEARQTGASMEILRRVGTLPEKLVAVGLIVRKDGLTAVVVAVSVLMNLLVLSTTLL